MIKVSPKLMSLPVHITIRDDLTDETENIRYVHIPKFGYRAIYTVHSEHLYHLTIRIGDRNLDPIRVQGKCKFYVLTFRYIKCLKADLFF